MMLDALRRELFRPGAVDDAFRAVDVAADPVAPNRERTFRLAFIWTRHVGDKELCNDDLGDESEHLYAVTCPFPDGEGRDPSQDRGFAAELRDWAHEVAVWLSEELQAGSLAHARHPLPLEGQTVQVAGMDARPSARQPGPHRAAPPPTGSALTTNGEELIEQWCGVLEGRLDAGEVAEWARIIVSYGDEDFPHLVFDGLVDVISLRSALDESERAGTLEREWHRFRRWLRGYQDHLADPVAWNRHYFTTYLRGAAGGVGPRSAAAVGASFVRDGLLTAREVEAILSSTTNAPSHRMRD